MQARARETVRAVLDAVLRVIAREGVERATTNRIAEVAGVSVGSVYQYFPDKHAIFSALHDRHASEIGALVAATAAANGGAKRDALVRELMIALIDAHAKHSKLDALLAQLPGGDGGASLRERLRTTLRPRIADERKLFALANVMESLAHGAVYHRPPSLSLTEAKEEALRVLGRILS